MHTRTIFESKKTISTRKMRHLKQNSSTETTNDVVKPITDELTVDELLPNDDSINDKPEKMVLTSEDATKIKSIPIHELNKAAKFINKSDKEIIDEYENPEDITQFANISKRQLRKRQDKEHTRQINEDRQYKESLFD